jgi:sugar lactone lactonase YvrE
MNASQAAVPILDLRQTLGESPVWSIREQALYWVDLRERALHRLDPVARRHSRWPLPGLVGGVVLDADGGLVVALQSGVYRFEPASASLALLVTVEPAACGNRHNDTKVDRDGRLWTTTMRDYGAAATGSLYRVDADLRVKHVLGGLRVPNALAWSPDDRVLYFADTRDGRLRAYEFARETGELGRMRVLVDDGVLPGRPDGATVDSAGCIWNARYGGGCVARNTPRGTVDRIVGLPVSQVTSCAFGDADLRTLYITTATQRMTAAELAAQPSAGALFALRVEAAGMPEPAFRSSTR